MTSLLALALMGIFTAMVLAGEGDYSGIKMIGKILVDIVGIVLFLLYLYKTGIAGMVFLVVISIIISVFMYLHNN